MRGAGAAGPDRSEAPADLRTLLPASGAWAGALLGLGLLGPALTGGSGAVVAGALTAWLGAVAVLSVLLRGATWPVRSAVLVALACLLVGAAAGAARVVAVAGGPVPALAARSASVTVEAVVVSDPSRREGTAGREPYAVVRVRVERVTGRGVTTAVRTPVLLVASDPAWLRVIPGERVVASGRLAPPDPDRSRGPEVALLRAGGPPELLATARVFAWAEPLREGLRAAVAGLPDAPGGLVPALVVGDEHRLPDTVRNDMRATGLTHLTAVSGANVAIVLGAVLGLARWAGLRSYTLPVLGSAAVLAFVVLARPQPSVVRAAAMGLVALAALTAGGRRRGTAALGTAVLVLVLADPWLARSPGFALSVLATGGILVLAPVWRDAMPWLPRPLAEALAIPLSAQVACTPVLVLLSGDASLASVPANLLAAPAVAPATVLGAAAAVVTPVLPWAGPLLGWPAGLAAWWIVLVAEQGARLPGATMGWPGGAGGVLAAVGTAAVGVLVLPAVLRRRGLSLALAVLLAVLLARPPLPGWPPPGWVVVACDVGQGDAAVIRVGERRALVVDAGPDPRAVDACLDRLGVLEVPAVLLSHFHADHVDGLPGVLDGRRVGEVVVGPLDDPPAQAARVRRQAAAAGVPVRVATAGERSNAGGVGWEVLWPARLVDEGSASNNASLVLLVQAPGVTVLLTGDVEPAAQRAMLRARPDLRADVLKVPHHGSAYQEAEWLTGVGARLALVSVGADNTYGHPAPATLDLLTATGARVARTDQEGAVAVVVGRGGLGVASSGRRRAVTTA